MRPNFTHHHRAMKAIFYYLLLTLSTQFASAAPTLTTPYHLSPGSDIRIVFDEAMVTKDKVNTHEPNNLINIQPAWKGRILWKAENIAIFQPLEIAKLNTTYTFTTKPGITDLQKKPIKVTNLGKKTTPSFSITKSRTLKSIQSHEYPSIFLRFSDDVSAAQLAPYFYYQSEDGSRAAAQLTTAKYGDVKSMYYARTSWTRRSRAAIDKLLGNPQATTKLNANTPLKNCLIVRPIDTLPIGQKWQLHCIKNAPNLAKTAKTQKEQSFRIGTKSPFTCQSASAIIYPNEPRFIRIRFSNYLAENTTQAQLKNCITITPTVPNLQYTVKQSYINIHGDFNKTDSYHINLNPSLKSKNGISLTKQFSEKVTFKHITPSVAIPSLSKAQFSHGQRKYPIETINIASLKVRIKALTMQQAVIAYQGFNQFLKDQQSIKTKFNTKRITLPFGLINGKLVHEQEYTINNKLDTSETLVLDWDKILPADRKNLIYFIDIEGTPKAAIKDTTHKVQSFLQLTDIGLAWKQNASETFLYCYSCNTGKPLSNVIITTHTKDADIVKTYQTNSQGITRIPHQPNATHLTATLGSDSYITPWRKEMEHVGLWRFPVKYDYHTLNGWKREALIFTDRQLYKPGETAHIKGIVRERKDNQHRIPSQRQATLSILDPADRILTEEAITLSDNGSFDHTLTLPNSNLGTYQIRLTFDIPEDQLPDPADHTYWTQKWLLERNSEFYTYFGIQEFRRNAFKVNSDIQIPENETEKISANVHASYYMGTAVAKGKLDWFLTATETGFYPEKFREFYFGNHLKYDPYYWNYYYGYSNGSQYSRRDSQKQNGSLELDENGNTSFTLTLQSPKFPSPQKIRLISEVTDGREQTLTSTSQTTLHPSSHYIGISRIDQLLRVSNTNDIRFIAVDKKGNHSKLDLNATATISHNTYKSVKVLSDDGKVTINNQKTDTPILTKDITLNAGKPTRLPFIPTKAGEYTVTIESKDPNGNKISSAMRLRVYGSNEYPWAVGTGMKIELTPEKKHYQPGDNARILVKTPIEGTALVTVERSGIKRHYLREIKMSSPIIELPIEHQDAPNVYVSVLLIRGSSVSTHQYKEPALRLGYCTLKVENKVDNIDITLDSPSSSYRPGEIITLTGTLTDYEKNAIPNAELTFYAEDNGILDVIGYQTPNPLKHFNSPISLTVESGTSLSSFLQEMAAKDMEMINQSVLNKGYTIGGGGEEIDKVKGKVRKNFDPCAFWNPTLTTDAHGKFSFTFKAPDTLTSYRVMAVATAGAQKFGSTEAEITINKPLMLEPMTPRFANEGDTTVTKLYVANNSEYEATWNIELKTNSLSTITASNQQDTTKHATRQLHLKPGASAYLDFELSYTNTGKALWTWSATPTNVMNQTLNPALKEHLSDSMESHFDIIYPRPILKATTFKKLTNNQQNILSGIEPELLTGRGHIELHFSNNLLFKVQGAAKHLLRYPYGCVEQTTSSLMPWFAIHELKPYIPEFKKQTDKQILKSIQQGANRLLSMQTSDGGLAYWPGGKSSTPWATTYGGKALILAKQHGANVPDEALENIAHYLTIQVQKLIKTNTQWSHETASRALYTLSLMNKAKQSDLNYLYQQRINMNPSARAHLAMAMHLLDSTSQEARNLILFDHGNEPPEDPHHWMRYKTHNQNLLTALCHIAPKHQKTHQLMDKIIQSSGKRNHWGTTWANASTVNAMAAYAKAIKTNPTSTHIKLDIDGSTQTITLNSDKPMHTITIPLDGTPKLLSSSASTAFCNAVVHSKPALSKPTASSRNGLAIKKNYYRIRKDGKREPLTNPKVGDLVEVELDVTFNNQMRYVVIDDPLPASFEAVNSDFASQSTHTRGITDHNWRVSNQELRDDRALFFLNRSWYGKSDTISYLARITSSGKVSVPAAKVEAMYDPESYGLSASETIICQPRSE